MVLLIILNISTNYTKKKYKKILKLLINQIDPL